MKNQPSKYDTVRLLMPQWQGGNMGESYPLGARILAWLAPKSEAPLLEVPVEEYDGTPLAIEDGIRGRKAIVKQMRAARHILDAYAPKRVITFGGDCLVSQAPFAYLNELYDGELGVLWIDAHLDITTPDVFPNAHAMVLGNLRGGGDPELAKEVKKPLDAKRVMYAGVDEIQDMERKSYTRLGLRRASSEDLKDRSDPIVQWLKENDIRRLAIHLDLDVLDPASFRSLLFNMPNGEHIDAPEGKMTLDQIVRITNDAAAQADIVGFTFAEHMPWDDINLKNMMAQLPFMK